MATIFQNTRLISFIFIQETLDNKSVPKESPVTPSPFPRLRLLPKSSTKMELYRKRKEKSDPAKKKSPTIDNRNSDTSTNKEGVTPSSKSKLVSNKSANEKEVTKFKVRFGKAPDLNLAPRKKGKTRNDEMFDDVNEESKSNFIYFKIRFASIKTKYRSTVSVVINDEKLPSGWSKHMIKRKTSNKWDIVIQNEDEKKFRSRADLKSYFEANNQPYPEELFDFSSGKRTPSIRIQLEKR